MSATEPIEPDDTSPCTPDELRTLAKEMEEWLIDHECNFVHPDWRYVVGLRALADTMDDCA